MFEPKAVSAITRAEQITPQSLTALLVAHNLLQGGSVSAVHKRPEGSIPVASTRIAYLELETSPGARLSIPKHLVFKFAVGSKEPFFYRDIAPEMPEASWPCCYLSDYDPVANISWLLLEDLSQTHFQTQWPVPPDYHRCAAALDVLARLHAARWNDPRLEEVYRHHLTWEQSWAGRISLAIESFPTFIDFMSERLSPQRREQYERILASSEHDWFPTSLAGSKTLLHGDAHFWNFLFPRETGQRLFLIDWNPWDIGRSADDLAYMLALHWYPERRARYERPLLERYHRALLANGVQSYSWEALWQDYQLGVIRNLFIPIWQWQRGIHPSVWWSHLERAFLAYEDLGGEARSYE
ncbi:MAG: phosphotransferase [Chloroflexota bacterium]